jgi:hypothetical protein
VIWTNPFHEAFVCSVGLLAPCLIGILVNREDEGRQSLRNVGKLLIDYTSQRIVPFIVTTMRTANLARFYDLGMTPVSHLYSATGKN